MDSSLRTILDGLNPCTDAAGAAYQLELWAALASFERVNVTDLHRLVAARLSGHDMAAPEGCSHVDEALGECLRTSCTTRAVWAALTTGVRIGDLMLHAYRDGFEAGYIEAVSGCANELAAE